MTHNKLRGLLGVICVLCNCLPSSTRTAEIDWQSEETAFKSKLLQIFDVSKQQEIRVNELIKKTFEDIGKNYADFRKEIVQVTTERPSTRTENPHHSEQQCTTNTECVSRAQCNGKIIGSCGNDKICCGTNDSPMIEVSVYELN